MKHKAACKQLTNDRHPLPVAVEVQDSKDIVRPLCAHLAQSDGVLCSGQEHVAKVPGCCNQGSFIWRSCLVVELTCSTTTVARREIHT